MLNHVLKVASHALVLFVLVGLQSCQKEELTATKSFPNVEEDLWVYFQKFEEEGRVRGLEIDLVATGITGEIGSTANSTWVGQCNHNTDEPNHVIINQNFWNGADQLRREKIVFHELGHCFLGKGHNDEVNEDGTCKSIMRSGVGACIDNYTEKNRAEYQDELFDM